MLRNRNELITPTDQVNLTVVFRNNVGAPVDADSFPQLYVVQPSGLVAFGPTSAGVSRIGVGNYSYTFTAPFNGPLGVWNDVWVGIINGFRVEANFSFILTQTDVPSINIDGYAHIGDNVGFNYSQTSILNINKLLKTLKARLNSSGKAKSTDAFGNIIYLDCDIFSVDMLVTFLGAALSDFNQVPYFTMFTFDDTPILDQFHDIIVEGATLNSLASQALIERGREFAISDNGVSFTPPTMSELLNTQYSTLLTQYFEKLKMIKSSMRPSPLSLGSLRIMNNTALMKFRHRRANRLL